MVLDPLVRIRNYGVCTPAGRNIIDGREYLSFRFENGFVHFPIGTTLLADLSDVGPLLDEEGEPLTDKRGVFRYPPLSRLGDSEKQRAKPGPKTAHPADSDIDLPELDDDIGELGEIAA